MIELTKNQKEAIAFAKKNKRVMLAMSTGAGKTLVGETLLKELKGEKLLISTKPLISAQWKSMSEFADLANFRKIPKKQYDVVIIDESTKVKSPTSQTYKDILKITNSSEYVILLTGTPAGNGLQDLYGQYSLILRNFELGMNYYAFLNKFFIKKQSGSNKYYFPKSRAKNSLKKIIKPVSYFCKSDHGYSPSSTQISLYYKLTKEQKVKMNEKIAIDNLQKIDNNRKISSNFLYTKTTTEIICEENPKLDLLKTLPTPLIVAFKYDQERKDLLTLDGAVDFRGEQKLIEEWNKGQIKYLLINYANEVYGFNLQFGGFGIAWYCATSSYERFHQLNARLIRRGQTEKVNIYLLKGSYEDGLFKKIDATEELHNFLAC